MSPRQPEIRPPHSVLDGSRMAGPSFAQRRLLQPKRPVNELRTMFSIVLVAFRWLSLGLLIHPIVSIVVSSFSLTIMSHWEFVKRQ